MFLSSGHGQVTRSCQSPPNKCYSLFRQERARSSGTAITLQGPGWEETDLCSKRAKCLDPPSRLNWGSQAPRTQLPLAASGHRSARAGPADCVPGRWPRHQTTGGDGGRGSPPPQGLGPRWAAWWGLLSPAGHSPSLFPWAPQVSCQPEATWAGGTRGKGGDPPLNLPVCHPPLRWLVAEIDHQQQPTERGSPGGGANGSADQWLSKTTNDGSLTVARLGEGPLQCRPIAERPLVVSR